jgi:hypothetical protein
MAVEPILLLKERGVYFIRRENTQLLFNAMKRRLQVRLESYQNWD